MSNQIELELLDLLSAGSRPDRVAAELELALLSPRLAAVIEQLRWLVPVRAHDDTLADVLGEYRDAVLTRGLAALPPERLNRLLQQPELLSDLQEEVLLAETPYWEDLLRRVSAGEPIPTWITDPTTETGPGLGSAPPAKMTSLAKAASLPPATTPATSAPSQSPAGSPAPGRRLGWWLSLAAAAAVAAFWIWPGETPWGFQRSGALTAQLEAADYLNHLARLAGEFDRVSLDTAPALDRRLTEMLAGCQNLLEAPHPQLADADRAWLKERCEAWIKKFEEQRQRLRVPDVSSDVVASVRSESLKIVSTLREKLTERAASLSSQARRILPRGPTPGRHSGDSKAV